MTTTSSNDSADQADYGGLSDDDDDTATPNTASTNSIADNVLNSSSQTNSENKPTTAKMDLCTPSNTLTKDIQTPMDSMSPNPNDEDIQMKDMTGSKPTKPYKDTKASALPKLEYASNEAEEEDEVDGYIPEPKETPKKTNKRKLSEIESENEPKRKRQRRHHHTSSTKRDIDSIKASMSAKSHKSKSHKTKIMWNTHSSSKRNTSNHVINDSDTNDEDDEAKEEHKKDHKHHKKKHHKRTKHVMETDSNSDSEHSKSRHTKKSKHKDKKRKKKDKDKPKVKEEEEVKKVVVPKTERIPHKDSHKSRKSPGPTTNNHPIKKEKRRSRSYERQTERQRERSRQRDRDYREHMHHGDRDYRHSRNGYRHYRHEVECEASDNLTGLWIQDEEIKFVLYEDFKTGEIIGFMKMMENTVSTICGMRRQDRCYDIQQIFHDDPRNPHSIEHVAELSINYNHIKLSKIGTNDSWDLKLKNKRDIPDHLFHELEQLKKHRKFGIYRHDSHRFHPRYPPNGHPMPFNGPPGGMPSYPPPLHGGAPPSYGMGPGPGPHHGYPPHPQPPYLAPYGAHGMRPMPHRMPMHGYVNGGPLPPPHPRYPNGVSPPNGRHEPHTEDYKRHRHCSNGDRMKIEHKMKEIEPKIKEHKEPEKKIETGTKSRSKHKKKRNKHKKDDKTNEVIDVSRSSSPSPSLSPLIHTNNGTKEIAIGPPDISPLLSPLPSPNSAHNTTNGDDKEKDVVVLSDDHKENKQSKKKAKGNKKKKKKKKERERRKKEKIKREKKEKEKKKKKREMERERAMKKVFEAVADEFRKYKDKYNSRSELYKSAIKKCSQRVQDRYKERKNKYNSQTARLFLEHHRNVSYIEKLVERYVQRDDKKTESDAQDDDDDKKEDVEQMEGEEKKEEVQS